MITPRTELLTPSGLLLEALDKRWKTYRAELKRCRAEFSNEAVHDIRIATRRLLSLIKLMNSFSPRPRLQKLSRAFKNQLDEFDDLRDTQVMLAEFSKTAQELPQLQSIQEHLQTVEADLLKSLRKKIKKFDLDEISNRMKKTRASTESNNQDDILPQILQAVDDAYLLTRQRFARIDTAQPPTIHRVRIAFKSFRYMVEIVHPLLDGFPTGNLKRMNDYQSLMGEIQDAEIIIQTLADFSSDASFDPEPVRRYYERRHAETVSAYTAKMDQLAAFWRHSPDQPFPWEN